MISNVQNTPQTKPKLFNTCLQNNTNRNSSILDSDIYSQSAESATSKMSTITASVAASAANRKPTTAKPPMETVIVNSIIYSKPAYCRISVDLNDMPVNKKTTTCSKILKGSYDSATQTDCFNETNSCSSTMASKSNSVNFNAVSCLAGMAASSSLGPPLGEDTKLYRMCTTLNGSMHHQISDLCDNIFAMAGFYSSASGENDDDNFIEFAYKDGDGYCCDDDEEEGDDDDEDDSTDDEEDYCSDETDDDDNDVVDFLYEFPNERAPKLCEKKVRFNDKPTVHILRTWTYAHRAARKGHWQTVARDRERFNLRIQRTALVINPILESEHRQTIYEKRFANFCTENATQNEVSTKNIEAKETSSIVTEPKKPHQKKKRRKKRFCKMGNKHYF